MESKLRQSHIIQFLWPPNPCTPGSVVVEVTPAYRCGDVSADSLNQKHMRERAARAPRTRATTLEGRTPWRGPLEFQRCIPRVFGVAPGIGHTQVPSPPPTQLQWMPRALKSCQKLLGIPEAITQPGLPVCKVSPHLSL